MFRKRLGITVCEAAATISVSELTMRRKIWAGEVRAEKVGGRILVPIDEVRRLVGLSREGAKKPRQSKGTAA